MSDMYTAKWVNKQKSKDKKKGYKYRIPKYISCQVFHRNGITIKQCMWKLSAC